MVYETVRFSCRKSAIVYDLIVQPCMSQWGILNQLDAHVCANWMVKHELIVPPCRA